MRGVTRWLVLLPAAVIAAYAALLPLGEWQMDEFVLLHGLQEHGIAFVAERLQNWSPRPLSELILWFYHLCVVRLDRPLITSFLAGLWLLLLAAAFVASRWPRIAGARSGGAPPMQGLAVATLIACFLLLEKPGVFYWPAGAVAYLPTLAGVTFVIVAITLAPDIALWRFRARVALCTGLLVALCSSEMGAMFVLLGCAGQVLRLILAHRGSPTRTMGIWLLPAAVAVLLLVTFGRHRAGMHETVPAVVPTLHHLPASVGAGLARFGDELLGIPVNLEGTMVLWLGAALKACLFQGFRPRLTEAADRSRVTGLIQCAALLGAALFTVVFAYWQFGAPCCERHETMRQCFIVLALFAAAGALPIRLAPNGRRQWLRSEPLQAALLVLPLLVLGALRLPELMEDYTHIRATVMARDATWRSGSACCDSAMDFYDPPHTALVTSYALRPGRYARLPPGTEPSDPNARDASDILAFFGKSSLLVHAPGELMY